MDYRLTDSFIWDRAQIDVGFSPFWIFVQQLGATAIGIQTKEGIVLAVEKRSTSRLLVTNSLRKIEKLDQHIWCATSGVVPDARTLIDHARVETQTHWFNYNETISVGVCATSVGKLMGHFGTGKMSRPYGVGMLIAGIDEKGPQLYYVDPSGTKTQFKAKAIGSGQESAQNALKDEYSDDMTLEQAKEKALEILAQVISEKINDHNVEVAIIPVNPQ